MLTYVPNLTFAHLDQGTSFGCVLAQGSGVADTDLNVVFCNSDMLYFSPYSITYAVGFVSADGQEHFYGSVNREPLKLREGRYRPNFQVGDNWFTGDHVVVWSYKVDDESEILTRKVPFIVSSNGLSDKRPLALGYSEVSATVIIIP